VPPFHPPPSSPSLYRFDSTAGGSICFTAVIEDVQAAAYVDAVGRGDGAPAVEVMRSILSVSDADQLV
jgi:hypothetical protein